MDEMFSRTIALIGEEAFRCMQSTRVILFGVGGVGGWCAETLIRTGIGHLTIVDFDTVAPSNINRQLVATPHNIGLSKVEQMRERLLHVCPQADVLAVNKRFSSETAAEFDFSHYDYVLDAIDSVEDKMLLIQQATSSSATLYSSMGAGRKLDPTQIRVAEFFRVQGCPLARALRNRMRHTGVMPLQPFQCVYSPELSALSGTIAPVVGTFGMTLASLVVQDVMHKICKSPEK